MWSPTPVYGFRAWEIAGDTQEYDGGGGGFLSTYERHPKGTLLGKVEAWPTARKEAICHRTSLSMDAVTAGHAPENHDAPHWGCHCGVYVCDDPNHESVKSVSRLTPYAWQIRTRGVHAIGIVELTGTIVEHQRGARGQYGEIRHLWVTPRYADEVALTYPDVPVTVVDYPDCSDEEFYSSHLREIDRTRLYEEMCDAKRSMEEDEPWRR